MELAQMGPNATLALFFGGGKKGPLKERGFLMGVNWKNCEIEFKEKERGGFWPKKRVALKLGVFGEKKKGIELKNLGGLWGKEFGGPPKLFGALFKWGIFGVFPWGVFF